MAPDRLDPRLNAYVSAKTDAEASDALSTLLEEHVQPIARRIAAHRLADRRGRHGPAQADAEDAVAAAMLTLVERLQAVRAREAAPIEQLEHYAASVVHSCCAHLLRQRAPERTRLKQRLRYVLSSDDRLALWTDTQGRTQCGAAGARTAPTEPARETALATRIEQGAAGWAELSPRALADALVAALPPRDGALPFDTLVNAVVSGAAVREPRQTDDTDTLAAPEPAIELTIHRRRLLARAWEEVTTLPVPQRTALLLNLRSATGAGLLWLLPTLGVATLRDVAAVLGLATVELARLWPRLPLDDDAIAARLGCTRQQVINFRMAARKRLGNRMRAWHDRPAARRRANLDTVSSS